ncbi:MAG: hypothetical protein Q9221_004720 [Calogaya cf. arnoldii]
MSASPIISSDAFQYQFSIPPNPTHAEITEFYETKKALLERIHESYCALEATLHLLSCRRDEVWKASPTSIREDGTLDRTISNLRKKLLDHLKAFWQVQCFFQALEYWKKNDYEYLARVAEECVFWRKH